MASGATYIPLQTDTLTSTSTAVTFSNISQSYTDLVLVAHMKLTSGSTGHLIFNGTSPSGSLYEILYFSSSGSAFQSKDINSGASIRLGEVYGSGISSVDFATCIAQIGDYAQTNKYKSVIVKYDDVNNESSLTGGTWRDTSAISSITFTSGSTGQFVAGCTFTIYGIAQA